MRSRRLEAVGGILVKMSRCFRTCDSSSVQTIELRRAFSYLRKVRLLFVTVFLKRQRTPSSLGGFLQCLFCKNRATIYYAFSIFFKKMKRRRLFETV